MRGAQGVTDLDHGGRTVYSSHGGDPLMPVWLAIGLLFAVLVSVGAGVLAWLGGAQVAAAILTAGGAFCASVTLIILIIKLFRA